MNQILYDEGFLIVATCHAFYKNTALTLIDSLEEYYPECKIMVSTLPEWEEEFREFDSVVEVRTDGPDERRAKLWALQRTVFKKTCYLDADMEVVHDDIRKVWDLLDEDHDCAFTVIYAPAGASTAIYVEEGARKIRDNKIDKHLRYHGGFFLWWHDAEHPNAIAAMQLWWSQWNEINQNSEWWVKHPEIYGPNRSWDQFTWWWIKKNIIPDLRIQEVEGEEGSKMYRWNWCSGYMGTHRKDPDYPPVILHKVVNRSIMNSYKDMLTGDNTVGG